jgi:hypothetical protein
VAAFKKPLPEMSDIYRNISPDTNMEIPKNNPKIIQIALIKSTNTPLYAQIREDRRDYGTK